MKYRVYSFKCKEYVYDKLYEIVKCLLGQDGIFYSYVPQGTTVLVKPNLLSPLPPESNVVTHYLLIKAIVDVLHENGCKIMVGDSPGGYFSKRINDLWVATSMNRAVHSQEELVAFERNPIQVAAPYGKLCKTFILSQYFVMADVVINVPKLKTHTFTTLSGGIKNLFGMIPGQQKNRFHRRFPGVEEFAEMLVDLSTLICPEITILDGVWGLEGNGPGVGGTPKNFGMILASENVLALDIAVAKFLYLQPESLPIIRAALTRKAFDVAKSSTVVTSGDVMPQKVILPEPEVENEAFEEALHKINKRIPIVDKEKCILCMFCVKNCPMNAITCTDGRINFLYKKCISCGCCSEMCLNGAILLNAHIGV